MGRSRNVSSCAVSNYGAFDILYTMKTSLLCLALLITVVIAQPTSFVNTSTQPDDITPLENVALRRRSGGEGTSGEEGADALGDAFHQVAQGLLRVQEALRLQEQEAERRAQEALRLQEQRAATALREVMRQMKPKHVTPSGSTSTNPQSVASSAPGATATGGAAAGAREEAVAGHQGAAADEDDWAKQRIELRIRQVKAKWDKAVAAPSTIGEKLCKLANERRLDDVRRLLDSGADANYINSFGRTPLIEAVFRYDADSGVVSLLLERGADVNGINVGGWTALHYAAYYDSSGRIVSLLIDAGADVDARDVDGETPLHEAAFMKTEAAVRALLAAGARKTLRCWNGWMKNQTPFDVTKSDAMRELLRP